MHRGPLPYAAREQGASLWSDVERTARESPAQALALAFVAGAVLRRVLG